MVKSISKLNTVRGFLLHKNMPVQDGLSGVFARASAEHSVQQQLGEGNPVGPGWYLCASLVLLSASSQLPLEAVTYPLVLSQMGFRYFKKTKNYCIALTWWLSSLLLAQTQSWHYVVLQGLDQTVRICLPPPSEIPLLSNSMQIQNIKPKKWIFFFC